MANFIPVLSFGSAPSLIVTFDTPPEGDPQNETLATEKEQVRSVGGQLFTSDFYDYKTFTLRFILQSNAVALKLKRVFEDYALKGESFTYFPHSDDQSIRFGVELESESVTFNRDHPDGMGGFLWSFEFTLVNVNKTAPRITRSGRTPTPVLRPPSPVTDLRLVESEQTSIDIAWGEPITTGSSQIKHYSVSIRKKSEQSTTTTTTTSLTRTFTSLEANTAYVISIIAVNDDDLSSPASTLEVTTPRAPLAPPTAVRNFAASEITTTAAKFTWDAPTSSGSTALSLYDLSFAKVGADATIESIVNAPSTETTVSSFEANTQYDATIFARNLNTHPDVTKINRDGPMTTIRFRTMAAIIAPTAVQNLVASNVGEETATLSWSAPDSTGGGTATISKYQVKVSGALDSTAVDVTSTSHNLTGLSERTQYTYQVRAVNSSNLNGPWSSVTFTTETARLMPPAPSVVAVETRRNPAPYIISLIFDWPRVGRTPFLDIDEFRIYRRKKGSTEDWIRHTVSPSSLVYSGARTSVSVETGIEWDNDNEDADQVYEFQMTAYNPVGESPRSSTVEGTKLQMVEELYEGTKVRKRIFNPNSFLSVGDYHFTSDLGDRDADMDMFSEVEFQGLPQYRGINIPGFTVTTINAIAPSTTNPDRIAIAFEGRNTSTETTGFYLIEIHAVYIKSSKRWAFFPDNNTLVRLSKRIQGLTAYSEMYSIGGFAPGPVNRYMMTFWDSRNVLITSKFNTTDDTAPFTNIETVDILRHQTNRDYTWYDNSALASFENKFWVVDFYDETAYAYKLKERTTTTPNVLLKDVASVTEDSRGRVTSVLAGPRLNYSYPSAAWARKRFIFFVGSSDLKSGQFNTNKVYAFTTFNTRNFGGNFNQFSSPIRMPRLEFTIDNRTSQQRLLHDTTYSSIFFWKNRIFVSCSSDANESRLLSTNVNNKILAFKL